MSFFEDASLVYIPSAVKSGKTYSVKPTDGTGDLTFTRASNATRVASNGLIEKVRENLFLQSNTFDTTWTTIDSSVTSGQSGYDGSSDAWLLENTDAGGYIRQDIILSGVQTLSVYAKAGTLDFIRIRATVVGTNVDAYFDLSTGTYAGTAVGTAIDATITSMGSGWYRCTLTYNESITSVRFYAAIAYNDLTDTSGNIYIQDAMLEQGDVMTDYIATTTAAVSVGPVSGLPRLDYLNSSCPRLLLEPQRTNLVTYSEQFDNADWTLINATITPNADISPDGYTNADRIYDDAATAQHRVGRNISVVSGTTYTFSAFAKKGSLRYCYLLTTAAGTSNRYYFDLQDGVSITAGGKIEDYGSGWYRISAQVTASATSNEIFSFNLTDSSSSATYSGTGTGYHIIYGYQVEAGAYATSLISTLSTSVTRVADAASKTGISSLIGQTEGTIFVEATIVAEDSVNNRRVISIGDNTSSNQIQIFNPVGTDDLRTDCNVSSTSQWSIQSGSVGYNTTFKCAVAYKENDVAFYVNGTLIGTDNLCSIPATSRLAFARNDFAFAHEGNINQALVFKTRLTNAQLAELTTL